MKLFSKGRKFGGEMMSKIFKLSFVLGLMLVIQSLFYSTVVDAANQEKKDVLNFKDDKIIALKWANSNYPLTDKKTKNSSFIENMTMVNSLLEKNI